MDIIIHIYERCGILRRGAHGGDTCVLDSEYHKHIHTFLFWFNDPSRSIIM